MIANTSLFSRHLVSVLLHILLYSFSGFLKFWFFIGDTLCYIFCVVKRGFVDVILIIFPICLIICSRFSSILKFILAGLTEQIKLDRYLLPHFRYYLREVRTVVYYQCLESYKSVTIEAGSKAFGVTVDFIDLELSRFIAGRKLHSNIDKVAGVLETNRPDAKNALYQATI